MHVISNLRTNSHRYTILAPTILPKGFVDAKVASEKLVKATNIDEGEYRFGHTKVIMFNSLFILFLLKLTQNFKLYKMCHFFQLVERKYELISLFSHI